MNNQPIQGNLPQIAQISTEKMKSNYLCPSVSSVAKEFVLKNSNTYIKIPQRIIQTGFCISAGFALANN